MQQHKFDFAKRLAELVAKADDFDKAMLSPHQLRQLEFCRDVMITTSEEFAGDRIGELFGNDEGLDDLRAYRASRLAGTQAAGLATLPRDPDEVYSPRTLVIDQQVAA